MFVVVRASKRCTCLVKWASNKVNTTKVTAGGPTEGEKTQKRAPSGLSKYLKQKLYAIR